MAVSGGRGAVRGGGVKGGEVGVAVAGVVRGGEGDGVVKGEEGGSSSSSEEDMKRSSEEDLKRSHGLPSYGGTAARSELVRPTLPEGGPLRAVHLSHHKWPGG